MKGSFAFALAALCAGPAFADATGPDRGAISIPAGQWQNTYDLSRIDPRIRTNAGAKLMAVEVVHNRGESTAKVTWVADRAVCEDPTQGPCEWVGSSGDATARIIGNDLVFSAQISADETDPVFVVLRGPPAAQTTQQPSGYMMNARGGYAYRFNWRARFRVVAASAPTTPKATKRR
jgi:hypothetical protein